MVSMTTVVGTPETAKIYVLKTDLCRTVKPVLFACFLFRDFGDLGDVAKVTGCKYSKSHHLLVHLLYNPAKTPKLRVPK